MEPKTLPPSGAGHAAGGEDGGRVPGLVVVFSGGAPCARVIALGAGPVELGRDEPATGKPGKLDDGRVSRRHALVAADAGRCLVTDLGSQNGTSVDGERIAASAPTPIQCVLRIGDTLLVPCDDVRPLERTGVALVDGFVRGPAMLGVLEEAARAARAGTTLHVRGESGSGKEGVAQAFHRAGARGARALVAVNCAAIPHGLAERLLFGARRGAYTGAETDAGGYLQEAEGSTLFLDEIAELELPVQAKLLRVLESHEVLPLGASRPRKVDFALCSATSKDLRALVAAGAMREDLYFRVGRPVVALPPLRRRPEEIPALIAQELARLPAAPIAHVSLVEQCLLRAWPGNVRELLAEVRSAAHAALSDGNRVESRHLAATAGSAFGAAMPGSHRAPAGVPAAAPVTAPAAAPGTGAAAASTAGATAGPAAGATADPAAAPTAGPTAGDESAADSTGRASPTAADWPRRRTPRVDPDTRRRIEDALRANAGNVAATARALGLHRTQLRRLLERHGIAATDDPPGAGSSDGSSDGSADGSADGSSDGSSDDPSTDQSA